MDSHQRFARFQNILNQLGNPHLHLPPTIHVAGTNGKGSTIAFMRSIMENAGYTVHTYTSPHLMNVTERFMVASKPLSQNQFDQTFARIEPYSERYGLGFFEQMTLMAFLLFAEVKADYCLMEVGIGGELDPTNAITHSLATIITTIDYDHMDRLGPTLIDIAHAKAGIIKDNCPVITGVMEPQALNIIQEKASTHRSPLYKLGTSFDFKIMESAWQFCMASKCIKLPYLGNLRGHHQVHNAALAIAALMIALPNTFNTQVIEYGIKQAIWPGRLEQFIYQGRTLWFDGAHNVQGAGALCQFFKQRKEQLCVIVAQQDGRDTEAFISELYDITYQLYKINLNDQQALQFTIKNIITNNALNKFSILVTGSLYLYSLLCKYINN